MIKSLSKVDDVTLSLNIDPAFRGILRGFAYDVSEGCELKGELIMTIRQRTRIKRLETVFTGLCYVHFKTSNGMGVPTSEGTETRGIYLKRVTHFDEYTIQTDNESRIRSTLFEAGVYKFPFSIMIPASLPHSFLSKYGSIDYQLSAIAGRSAFVSDMRISRPIVLRRSLMNDLSPIAPPTQTVVGTKNAHIASYSATAPSMVYCEGGLLKIDIQVILKDPARFSVRRIACGLKEKISYRTTGKNSSTNQRIRHDDTSYPLGCSTFFPFKYADYNPSRVHNYNAIFRLYPKVRTDNKAKLIAVRHMLFVHITVEDNNVIKNATRRKSDTHSELTAARRKMQDEGRLAVSNSCASGDRRRSLPTHLQYPLTILQLVSSKLRHHQNGNNANSDRQDRPTSACNNDSNSNPNPAASFINNRNVSSARRAPLLLNRYISVSEACSSRNSVEESSMFGLRAYGDNSNYNTSTAVMTPARLTDRFRRSGFKFNDSSHNSNDGRNQHILSIPRHQLVMERNRRRFSTSTFEDIGETRGSTQPTSSEYDSNPFQYYKAVLPEEEGSYECELTIPIIVTSREEYRENDVPALPDYQTIADGPPSYQTAMRSLPPVPLYTIEQ